MVMQSYVLIPKSIKDAHANRISNVRLERWRTTPKSTPISLPLPALRVDARPSPINANCFLPLKESVRVRVDVGDVAGGGALAEGGPTRARTRMDALVDLDECGLSRKSQCQGDAESEEHGGCGPGGGAGPIESNVAMGSRTTLMASVGE